ncbi:hypothetical protein BP5796_09286 [Coleophoma crateriformis]|uniref:NACHT domain-containing protein n=1 Tax=Coleophoma crateriformis TaxID=565419 RepID=A0A3D8R3P6_9HELO|nr:hypothetical protein BP5796_09286 [Coleophoma crateriformis]
MASHHHRSLGLRQVVPTGDDIGNTTIDIIAIHGLATESPRTWEFKTHDGTVINWLADSDMLPEAIPEARIFTYDWDANYFRDAPVMTLLGHADTLLALVLDTLRLGSRPIIFIASCFGGLILAKAITRASEVKSPYESVLRSTVGAVFLATPFRGSDAAKQAQWQVVVGGIMGEQTSTELIDDLNQKDTELRTLTQEFAEIAGRSSARLSIHCFYETKHTEMLNYFLQSNWTRRVPAWISTKTKKILVTQRSACLDTFERKPLYATHSGMNKFDGPKNSDFVLVKAALRDLISKAPVSGELQEDDLCSQALRECIECLQVTDPEFDMAMIEVSKDSLLKECSSWILDDIQLQLWRDSDTCPLLWINGDPGKGKTMLMISLVRELSKLHGNPSMTFFFCKNTDIRLNNAVAILRGLILKLAMNHPPLAKFFNKKYGANKNQLDGSIAVYALFDALSHMTEQAPGTTLLIDALDECNAGPERDTLLKLITKDAKSSSKAKWLLSSRNYPELRDLLKMDSQMLSLELNGEHISQAVHAFIQQKIRELTTLKGYSQKLAAKVKEELISRAGATFLWVALACKRLQHPTVMSFNTLLTLQTLPPGLIPLYTRMMEYIYEIDGSFCVRILRSACLAVRPLALEELVITAGLPEELLKDSSLDQLIDLCGSFITVTQGKIFFIHQSAKDYLVADAANLFSTGLNKEHGLVVDRSLQAMSIILKRDMNNLKHLGSQAQKGIIIDDRVKAIGYICCFWVDHLNSYFNGNWTNGLSMEYLLDGGPVHNFLLEHILHWFEALSLFGEYDKGILALRHLETIIQQLQSESNNNLESFIRDAIRFFLWCRPAVEEAPLQLYNSALLFAPLNSDIRKQFTKEIPKWVQIIPRLQNHWSQCLQTLEGHSDSVTSVAFSPDGQQLASAFSPDGQQLASGSYDHTVRLWDAKTGTALQTLAGHSSSVNSQMFNLNQQSSSTDLDLSRVRYGVNGKWITQDGCNFLWLPTEYRPNTYIVNEQRIAIGCSSGVVYILEFNLAISSPLNKS